MKLLLLIACAVAAVLGDNVEVLKEFAAENVFFIGDLYKELLRVHTDNFLVCPLAIQTTFALVNDGAKGSTAQQIATTLNLPETEEELRETFLALTKNFQKMGYILSCVNKIYLADYFKINGRYKSLGVHEFHTEIQNIDFHRGRETVDEINKWFEKMTHAKIKKLVVPRVLNENADAVLINALCFHGQWLKGFEYVQRSWFYLDGYTPVMVNLMSVTANFNYYESRQLNAKFLELPYKGDEVTMTIILPNDMEGLFALENRIADVLATPRYRSQLVNVYIPKFKIESTTHLLPILRRLGIRDAFSRLADFSGVVENWESFSISEVIQKASIEVDEQGDTKFFMEGSGGFDQPVFLANHPFLFYLKHKVNGILFIGRLSIPELAGI